MNKTIYSILILLASFCSVEANELLVEGKIAYYYPTDSTTRDIFEKCGIYSIEASYDFWCRKLYGWASVGYYSKEGQSIGDNTDTRATIVPLGFGLKYLFQCGCLKPYVGGGVLFSHLDTCNDSEFVPDRSKWGTGGVLKVGLFWFVTRCFFVNFFVDASWTTIDFSDEDGTLGRKADISNVTPGVGLGWRF